MQHNGEINPYQPPKARIDTPADAKGKFDYASRRPVLVWVIFIWSIVAIFATVVSYLLIYVVKIPLPAQQANTLYNVRGIDHVVSFISVLLFFSAALLLFLRSRIAVLVFGVRMVLMTTISFYYVFFKPAFSVAPEHLQLLNWIRPLSTLLISGLLFYYAFNLTRKGYYRR